MVWQRFTWTGSLSSSQTIRGVSEIGQLSSGYELLTRRSELVARHTNDLEFLSNGTMRVIIRRSKADPFGHGRIAFTSKKTTKTVSEWIAWRDPKVSFLFCPIYQGKAVNRDLSTTTVKRLVKSSAAAAGFDQEVVDAFSGHSLRVGAAQDLLCAGYDAAAIMRAGGWKSISILGRYLEMAEHNVWA